MTNAPIFHTLPSNADKLELLRQHFPGAIDTDAHGRIRINANALQLAIDPSVAAEEDGYELRWVGKREAYHSAFVPPQKILQPLMADSQDWDSTNNLLIKGDNLDALRLLRQNYFGQVKLIYIDPPYNTQSDAFIYRDDFSARQTEVLQQLGYNADTVDYVKNIYGARTHSGWLSFMYPRLLLAKDLLREDGVIFISIDDNEQAQLKLLCDEVFGEENHVATFPWKKRTAKSDVPFGVSQDFEWIVCYAKKDFFAGQSHERKYYATPDYPNDRWRLSDLTVAKTAEERKNSAFTMVNPKNKQSFLFNPKRVWAVTTETFEEYYNKGKIVFPGDYDFLKIKIPAYRVFESEDKEKSLKKHGTEETLIALSTQLPKEVGMSENGNKDFENLFNSKYFSFPKPVQLLQHLLAASSKENDIVLDFFAGSGTTAQAVMQLNAEDGGQRRFILVQIPQPIDAKKQKEAHSFVTETLGKADATIFEITAERIRRAGAKITSQHPQVDTGFRVFDVVDDPDHLILHKPLHTATQADFADLQQAITTPQPAQIPRVLYNLLMAEGLPLTEKIRQISPNALYSAGNTLFVLQSVDVLELRQAWEDAREAAQAAGQPLAHISIYAPWVQDDNFLLAAHSLLESLGLGEDRLRLRG